MFWNVRSVLAGIRGIPCVKPMKIIKPLFTIKKTLGKIISLNSKSNIYIKFVILHLIKYKTLGKGFEKVFTGKNIDFTGLKISHQESVLEV